MIWRFIAWLVTRPRIRVALVYRALRTPYTHITSADEEDIYMGRWWLFNPYPSERNAEPEKRSRLRQALPSVRIHWIRRPDQDRHRHTHPWTARTIILQGWYLEDREDGIQMRRTGHTGTLTFGTPHRISEVSDGGVWTLFITYRKLGSWGFVVDGKVVPWREYLGL